MRFWMTKHEVTRGVAPRVAPRGGSLGGLPQEPSHKKLFLFNLPSFWIGHRLLTVTSSEFKAKIKGKWLKSEEATISNCWTWIIVHNQSFWSSRTMQFRAIISNSQWTSERQEGGDNQQTLPQYYLASGRPVYLTKYQPNEFWWWRGPRHSSSHPPPPAGQLGEPGWLPATAVG